jgi:protein involved in polysaccharide export with SLBB domain
VEIYKFKAILVILTGLIISIQAEGQQIASSESGPSHFSETAPVPVVAPNHLLAPDDLIEIKVFQEQDLDTTTRITDSGGITFPLIGEVAIGGKTAEQAAQLIRDRLEARFLVDPHVTLVVKEQAKRLFTVLGQVQRPGTYRFPDRERLDLIQVIGVAGGYTRLADPGRVTIKRRVKGKEAVFSLNAKRMAQDQGTKPFEVAPGDLIMVAERIF